MSCQKVNVHTSGIHEMGLPDNYECVPVTRLLLLPFSLVGQRPILEGTKNRSGLLALRIRLSIHYPTSKLRASIDNERLRREAILGIEIRRVKVNGIDLPAFDLGVKSLLRACTEVSAVKVSEDTIRADELRLVRTVTCIDSLRALKEEETRPRA